MGTGRRIEPTWRPPAEQIAFYRSARYWRDASIADQMDRVRRRFPDRIAIRDSTAALTFGEVHDGAVRVAAWLRDRGLRSGEAVLFQLPNWHESAVVFHGIAMAGGVAVPLTPILRRREVGFIQGQTAARFVFAAASFRGFDYADLYDELGPEVFEARVWLRAASVPEGDLSLEQILAGPPPSAQDLREWRTRGDDAALVLFTSGTTADPKGAIHTHDGVLASTRMCESWFALDERDVLFNPSPVTHITGISLTFLFPATFGCAVTLQEQWAPEQAMEVIRRDRTTFMMFATPFLQALVDIAERDDFVLDHVRTIVCGGADVPQALSARANQRLGAVVRMYGATEAPNASCGTAWDPEPWKSATEGRWLFPTEGRVVDPETGEAVEVGVAGEAWWRAPQMCAGYLDAELNVASYTSDGFFRTGDLVTVDDLGYVTVRGRIKEIINRGGEKLSAREIEELILEQPEVAEVAVTPMSDPRLVEKVCAWVVLRDGHQLGLPELVDRLAGVGLAK